MLRSSELKTYDKICLTNSSIGTLGVSQVFAILSTVNLFFTMNLTWLFLKDDIEVLVGQGDWQTCRPWWVRHPLRCKFVLLLWGPTWPPASLLCLLFSYYVSGVSHSLILKTTYGVKKFTKSRASIRVGDRPGHSSTLAIPR